MGILALRDAERVIGCIVFALPPRETMKRYNVKIAWELARLFIEDCTPRNAESWFVARAIRWVRDHRPEVECLVSYADPSAGHSGTIYKAGNWIHDGRTDQERKTPRFDYGNPTTGQRYSRRSHVPSGIVPTHLPRVSKFRYVYWMDKTHEPRRQANKSVLNVTISLDSQNQSDILELHTKYSDTTVGCSTTPPVASSWRRII